MEKDDFFATNDNPKICLNKMVSTDDVDTSTYDENFKIWKNCENSNIGNCCPGQCCDGNNNCAYGNSTDARRNAPTRKACIDANGTWNTPNNITSLDDYEELRKKMEDDYNEISNPFVNTMERNEKTKKKKLADSPFTTSNEIPQETINELIDPTKELENLIGFVDEVEVNHRLLKKQYNELIFSPNEVINVDENINKFRYLELDRKLEKYDKKTYSLYKIFFY